MRRLIAARCVLLAGLALPASASRPVFHAITLEELVARSAHVLVVRQARPPTVRASLTVGPADAKAPPFELMGLRFEVLGVLRTTADRPLRRGDVVAAYSSDWEMQYEEHAGRVLEGRTLSYPADRYVGAGPTEPSKRYLLFLGAEVRREGVPTGYLMVPGAVEGLKRRPEVEKLLGGLSGRGGTEPAEAAGSDCEQTRKALERFLKALPRACRADGDCDGFFYRASPCLKAVVLAKPGVPPAKEAELLELQARVRAACPMDSVACSPIPFNAACRSNECVDAAPAPEPPKEGLLPVDWRLCREASDCILLAGVCQGSWEAVGARWRGEAEATIAKKRPTVDCAKMDPGPLPKAACVSGTCSAR